MEDKELINSIRSIGTEFTNGISFLLKNFELNKAIELIKTKHCINDETHNGEFPLLVAAGEGLTEIVELLIENGADVNQRNFNHMTALHRAVVYNKYNVVNILLENGANPNVINGNGYLPIHYTPFNLDYTTIFKLLKFNANLTTLDPQGKGVLHSFIQKGEERFFNILLRDFIDNDYDILNFPDKDGRTILHKAIYFKRFDLIKLIMNYNNIDINIIDKNNVSPLDMAYNLEIADLLLNPIQSSDTQ